MNSDKCMFNGPKLIGEEAVRALGRKRGRHSAYKRSSRSYRGPHSYNKHFIQNSWLGLNDTDNKIKMKSSMVHNNGISLLVLVVVGVILMEATSAYAAPHSSSYTGYYSPLSMEGQNPEYLLQTIARLRQALIADDDLENSKRGLDLGLGRGFSGSQAAKHLMGLAAANFAGGPGRRRRSEEEA